MPTAPDRTIRLGKGRHADQYSAVFSWWHSRRSRMKQCHRNASATYLLLHTCISRREETPSRLRKGLDDPPTWSLFNFLESHFIAPARTSGTIAVPAGGARVAPVTRDDVAAAAQAVCSVEARGQTYELTGPAAHSFEDIARIGAYRSRAPQRRPRCAKAIPVNTSAAPATWYVAMASPNTTTESIAAKTGIRCMNWPARLGPIAATPRAQKKKARTDATTDRYPIPIRFGRLGAKPPVPRASSNR